MENLLLRLVYYQEGYRACQQFLGHEDMVNNPYKTGTLECRSWAEGWTDALLCLPILDY